MVARESLRRARLRAEGELAIAKVIHSYVSVKCALVHLLKVLSQHGLVLYGRYSYVQP